MGRLATTILLAFAALLAPMGVASSAAEAPPTRRTCCGESCACDRNCPCARSDDRETPAPAAPAAPAGSTSDREQRAQSLATLLPSLVATLLAAPCDGPASFPSEESRAPRARSGREVLVMVSRWTT